MIDRREFLHTTLAGAAGLALAHQSDAMALAGGGQAAADREAVLARIAPQHEQTVKMLRDWIALPSIAAEDRNSREGVEYMAQLARDAGFQKVEIVETDGKPGVFAQLDAGAAKTVGLYFMYDVKHFEPSEWSSPPLESCHPSPAPPDRADSVSPRSADPGSPPRSARPRPA